MAPTSTPLEKPSWRDHLRAELRFMARAFFPSCGATMLVFGLLYFALILFGEAPPDPDAPSRFVLAPVAFGYGLVIGFWPGVVIGGARLTWKLVGAWALLPLTLIPLAIALALWLAADMLAGLGRDVLDAALVVGGEREWLAAGVGKAAHAGPVILVILIPLLLVDLGAIALDPAVLGPVFVLGLAFVLVIALAVIPSAMFSALVLLRAYLVRLRERMAERKAAHGRVKLDVL